MCNEQETHYNQLTASLENIPCTEPQNEVAKIQ